ncbi:MAG: hypothetical protein A2Z49_05115 [Chloroflexi bacterium RBG_19FT_COMBO_56_12]|nr:MAG: hypothetical protein A2Z49_05115 [Chloroflexi bacterium RBG_19FT_COMBO_56_12]
MSRNSLIALCLVWLLAGCSGSQATPFLPPTAAVEQAPAGVSAAASEAQDIQVQPAAPSATPDCTNNLTYLLDLTIPDGSQVSAGSSLDKRWKVQNSGTCNWDERYRIKLVSGSDLGAQEQTLFPARSGTELTVQILFIVPAEPGTYQSAWQAHDPQGNPFGDPFYIQVVVQNP